MLIILSIVINLDVISRSHLWLQLIKGTVGTANERFDAISVMHPLYSQQKPISSDGRYCYQSSVERDKPEVEQTGRDQKSKNNLYLTPLPHTKDVSNVGLAVETPVFSSFIHLQSEIIVMLL